MARTPPPWRYRWCWVRATQSGLRGGSCSRQALYDFSLPCSVLAAASCCCLPSQLTAGNSCDARTLHGFRCLKQNKGPPPAPHATSAKDTALAARNSAPALPSRCLACCVPAEGRGMRGSLQPLEQGQLPWSQRMLVRPRQWQQLRNRRRATMGAARGSLQGTVRGSNCKRAYPALLFHGLLCWPAQLASTLGAAAA